MQIEHEHRVGSSGVAWSPLLCLSPSQSCPSSFHMPVPTQAIQRVKPALPPPFCQLFETYMALPPPLQELS